MTSFFKIQAQGQALVVKIVNAAGTAPTVYDASDIDGTLTMPLTIRADTEFWFASALQGTQLTLTVARQDGTVVYSGVHEAHSNKPLVIAPEPHAAMQVTDLGAGDGLRRDKAIAETFPRYLPATNGSVLSTGRMTLTAIHLQKGAVVNSASFLSATTQLGSGTEQWFALYDSSRVLLGQTENDGATAWAANAVKLLEFDDGAITATYSGLYYLGINVTATTVPTLQSYTSSAVATALTPIISGTSTTGLDQMAPATAGAITAAAVIPYAYVS